MGLITKEVIVNLTPYTSKYYEILNYQIPRRENNKGKLTVPRGTEILVKVEHLPYKSAVKVDIKCDGCGKELKNIVWNTYVKYVKDDGKYYCNKCAKQLYSSENMRKTKLKNSISFEQWCIENNRQDILDRWDYELNKYKPNEIGYGSRKNFYFKCARKLHKSELKNINTLTSGKCLNINCKMCNSFAQWGIDNLGSDFLEKYWDYGKNVVDPWKTSKGYNKKVWIKCQEKDYHGSYDISPDNFINNYRCPYCQNKKVHPLDSLGKLLKDINLLHLWSDKNIKSPYDYAPYSGNEVYWKCPEGLHEDYLRKISVSTICEFRCPECQYSKGEEGISNYFISLGFIKINVEDYKILDVSILHKYKYYIPQMKYNGLIGLKGGLLSYDFYLPNYNLLIEYQGQQHEKYYKGFHKSKKDFERQQEHDKRKREYAQGHNIKLLEIWYWDFDNIESILQKELNLPEVVGI